MGAAAGALTAENVSGAPTLKEEKADAPKTRLLSKIAQEALTNRDPVARDIARKMFGKLIILAQIELEYLVYLNKEMLELVKNYPDNDGARSVLAGGIDFSEQKLDSYNSALGELAALMPELLDSKGPEFKRDPKLNIPPSRGKRTGA